MTNVRMRVMKQEANQVKFSFVLINLYEIMK